MFWFLGIVLGLLLSGLGLTGAPAIIFAMWFFVAFLAAICALIALQS